MAKKTVFFHIGTHKTGSTAIQKFLLDNEELLNKFGFIYNNSIYNGINHMELSHNINMWDEIYLSPDKSYIFSSEDFYYSFFQKNKNPNILKVLENYQGKFKNHNIKVIVYLRRQDEFHESLNNEIIKRHGFTGKFSDSVVPLDYYKALSFIAEKLEKTNIIVRSYEKEQFYKKSILSDFLSILDLEITDEYKVEQEVVNPSLTTEKMEFTRYINMLDLPIGFRTKFSHLIIKSALNSNEASLFRKQDLISPQDAKLLLATYEEGNQAIAREFLGREDGKLFYEEVVDDPNWKPFPGLTKEIAQEIFEKIAELDAVALEELYQLVLKKEEHTAEFIHSANFLMPLLIKILKKNIDFQPFSTDFKNNNKFFEINSVLTGQKDSADILREVALAFEESGDIETAEKIMYQAHLLRPEGPVIKRKLDEYVRQLKSP